MSKTETSSLTSAEVDKVIEALHAIVEDMGETYRYMNYKCVYVNNDGSPSCIVGHLVKRLNPDAFEQLAARRYMNHLSAMTIVEEYFPEWPFALAEALQVAQDAQDDRKIWGTVEQLFLDRVEYNRQLGRL